MVTARERRGFGHGNRGLGNLLAFTCHSAMDFLRKICRQRRSKSGTRQSFVGQLRFLADRVYVPVRTRLPEAMLAEGSWWPCRPDAADPQRGRLQTPAGSRQRPCGSAGRRIDSIPWELAPGHVDSSQATERAPNRLPEASTSAANAFRGPKP